VFEGIIRLLYQREVFECLFRKMSRLCMDFLFFSSSLFTNNFNVYKFLIAATRAMSWAGLVKFDHGNRHFGGTLGSL